MRRGKAGQTVNLSRRVRRLMVLERTQEVEEILLLLGS
jgi:hypothetical protein